MPDAVVMMRIKGVRRHDANGDIRADMFALILEADVVVCDLTILNANVFYELGIRHALRKKRTIMPSMRMVPSVSFNSSMTGVALQPNR